MDDVAVRVRNVSKIYKTYPSSLARTIAPFRKQDTGGRFAALKDVTYDFARGEVVALLGRNGSGKSTLAKIIAGVTTPTRGTVEVNGRVSAMLELTSGFDSQLSGIENIYLRALAMGLPRSVADARREEIVAFADIGDHIYQPVRTYSSGMKSRLGFAVSVNVDPDILIVDEVLAVGDEIFKLKCIDKMAEFREQGRTILFVSHAMGTVKAFCTQAIWINKGVLQKQGEVGPVVLAYEEFLRGERAAVRAGARESAEPDVAVEKSDIIEVSRLRFTNARGEPTTVFDQGEDIVLNLAYEVKRPISRLTFTYTLRNSEGIEVFASDKQGESAALATSIGKHRVRARLVSPPLLGGAYQLSGELWNNDSGLSVRFAKDRRFTVEPIVFIGTGIALVNCEIENE